MAVTIIGKAEHMSTLIRDPWLVIRKLGRFLLCSFLVASHVSLVTGLTGCTQKPEPPPSSQEKNRAIIGSNQSSSLLKPKDLGPAPDYELSDLAGNSIQLASLFQGKIVLLDFWATWCPPCREEIPGFVRLYQKYKDRGVEVVGVALDQSGPEAIQDFVKEFQVSYPILVGDSGVAQAYGGVRAIPTTFLIGREGRILQKYLGFHEEEFFESAIRSALGDS